MKQATMSNSNKCNHSDKDCVCGNHSARDVKKNKHHNSTASKLSVRKTRRVTL